LGSAVLFSITNGTKTNGDSDSIPRRAEKGRRVHRPAECGVCSSTPPRRSARGRERDGAPAAHGGGSLGEHGHAAVDRARWSARACHGAVGAHGRPLSEPVGGSGGAMLIKTTSELPGFWRELADSLEERATT